MANPTVGILDNFNRADENPLSNGGKWQTVTHTHNALQVVTNAAQSNGTTDGGRSRSAWIDSQFGGNVEAAATILQLPSYDWGGQYVLELFVKMSSTDEWGVNGYVLGIAQTGASTYNWRIIRYTDGAGTTLANVNQATAVNDEVFFEAKNDASGTLTAYQNGNQILQTTDTTYKAQTGYLWLGGLRVTTTQSRWDNFKGGVTVAGLSINVSDSIALTESIGPGNLKHMPNKFESISVLESIVANLKKMPSVSDSISVSEVIALNKKLQGNVNDLVALTEAVTIYRNLNPNVAETISVLESLTINLKRFISVLEAVTVSESVTLNLKAQIAVNDALSVLENLTIRLKENINVNDAIAVLESVIVNLVSVPAKLINVSDAISVLENLTVRLRENINVNEAISVLESVAANLKRMPSVNDSISVLESTVLNLKRMPNVFDSVSVVESIVARVNERVNVNELISLTESITVKLLGKLINVSEAISIVESVTVRIVNLLIGIVETISVGESVTTRLKLNRSISDLIALSEVIAANLHLPPNTYDSVGLSESIKVNKANMPSVYEGVVLGESLGLNLKRMPSIADNISIQELVALVLSGRLGIFGISENINISEYVTLELLIPNFTVCDLLDRFYAETGEFENKKIPRSLALEWLNQAQLNFVNGTEVLQDVWRPTLTSSVDLPANFLRVLSVQSPLYKNIPLGEIDYHKGIFLQDYTELMKYSIYGNKLYIWGVQTAPITLVIPYLKKPQTLTGCAALEIPKKYQEGLLDWMFSKYYAKAEQPMLSLSYLQRYNRTKENAYGAVSRDVHEFPFTHAPWIS